MRALTPNLVCIRLGMLLACAGVSYGAQDGAAAAAEAAAPANVATADAMIEVTVTGDVAKPGKLRVPANCTVHEAVQRAGWRGTRSIGWVARTQPARHQVTLYDERPTLTSNPAKLYTSAEQSVVAFDLRSFPTSSSALPLRAGDEIHIGSKPAASRAKPLALVRVLTEKTCWAEREGDQWAFWIEPSVVVQALSGKLAVASNDKRLLLSRVTVTTADGKPCAVVPQSEPAAVIPEGELFTPGTEYARRVYSPLRVRVPAPGEYRATLSIAVSTSGGFKASYEWIDTPFTLNVRAAATPQPE